MTNLQFCKCALHLLDRDLVSIACKRSSEVLDLGLQSSAHMRALFFVLLAQRRLLRCFGGRRSRTKEPGHLVQVDKFDDVVGSGNNHVERQLSLGVLLQTGGVDFDVVCSIGKRLTDKCYVRLCQP
jgi:hypothetical protein